MRIPAAALGILVIVHAVSLGAQRAAVLLDVTTVQVEPTVVADPDKVKEDFAPNLVMDSLVAALRDSNIEVGESSVRAHILLEEFSSGSTAKRVLVGLGAGRSTVAGRLIFIDAAGRELANVRIRVRGNLLFSGYQGGNTQRRQATNSFEQKLREEIARLKPADTTPRRPLSRASNPVATAAPANEESTVARPSQPTAPPAGTAAAAPDKPPVAPAATPAVPPQTRPTAATGTVDPAAARAELEAGTRAETARDWATALGHYQRARALDPSMSVFIDASIVRVRERMGATTESDALRRARQYDALGRRTEAISWYERALEGLAESDPNRQFVTKRLSELKGGQ